MIPNCEANNGIVKQAAPVSIFISMLLLFTKYLEKPVISALLLFMLSNKLLTDPITLGDTFVVHVVIVFRWGNSF